MTTHAAVEAIQFALHADEGMAFLRCWNEGDFTACRKEWPEAPDACYVGADPLHPETRKQLAQQDAGAAAEMPLLAVLQDIRKAAGDPEGTLMLDELVVRIRDLREKAYVGR